MRTEQMIAIIQDALPTSEFEKFQELYESLSTNFDYMTDKIAEIMEADRGETYGCTVYKDETDKEIVQEIIELLDGYIWTAVERCIEDIEIYYSAELHCI